MKPHEVLGVRPDATPEELRAARRRLLTLAHPDRRGGDVGRFRAIEDAYQAMIAKPDPEAVQDPVAAPPDPEPVAAPTPEPEPGFWDAVAAGVTLGTVLSELFIPEPPPPPPVRGKVYRIQPGDTILRVPRRR